MSNHNTGDSRDGHSAKTKKITKDAKQKSNTTATTNDKRFQAATYDPKFVAPGSAITKVKIDSRFADKMKSEKFQMAGGVDKYGRKNVGKSQLAGMSDYYYTDEKVQHPQQKKEQKKSKVQLNGQKKMKNTLQQASDDVQQNQQQNITDWMENYNQQSSDDMQQQNYDQLANESDGIWSDDEDVIKGQNVQVTRRLALCNYDWMNINAKDLMLLFSSFKPATGTILSVSVYYSEIGKDKLKLEEEYGPQGIWSKDEQKIKNQNGKEAKKLKRLEDENNKDEEAAFDLRKLRLYQKQRLKYCYAVIECNNNKTADQIYRQCDGNQFQNSNLLFDLRFVPDDLQFDKKMQKQRCNQIPVAGEVKNFVSRALGHSKVSLTWEDPELNDIANLKKKNWNKMTEEELEKIDWGMYINEQAEKADDNFNKIVNDGKKREQDLEEEDEKVNEAEIVTDWRKQCNKKYKRQNQQDQLQITFPSGFDRQAPSSKKNKTRKERWQTIKEEKNKKREQMELLVEKDDKQQFAYNPNDQRWTAVFHDPKFSIDPANSKFDPRKVGNVFQEVVKRNKSKNSA